MKIVNKRKFLRMSFVFLGILLFLIINVSNICFSKGEVKEEAIFVSSGDTLWTIAREQQKTNSYYANKEIRQIIYEIKKLNKIENDSFLVEGQKIVVKRI